MKRLLVALFLALVSMGGWAQTQSDVVYLKNGSIIKGTIIEAVPDGSVKIMTNDGSLFVFNMEEVSRIGKVTYETDTEMYYNNPGPRTGYTGFVEVAYGVGVNGGNERIYIKTTHGYQFNPYFFAGLGVGYDLNKGLNPIYADVRGTLDSKLSPYVDVKFGVNSENRKLYLAPEIGCRLALKNGKALDFGLSFDYIQHNYGPNYSEDNNAIAFGISFEY